MSVAARVPAGVCSRFQTVCHGLSQCPLRHRQRVAGRPCWFAACVPVSCLGDDAGLQSLAWRLLLLRHAVSLSGRWHAPRVGAGEWHILRLFHPGQTLWEPEALLDNRCLDGAGEDGAFDVVTVTDLPARAHALLGSAPWHRPVRMLRPPDESWRFRFFDAERHILSYVAHLRRRGMGDRLVLYLDAFDTAWLGCDTNLTQAFEAMGKPIFFAAEFDLYPAGLAGYPKPVADHEEIAKAQKLPRCRPPSTFPVRWEASPVDQHEPCLAKSDDGGIRGSQQERGFTDDGALAVYVNGGVYGGRAAALEVAIRRLLSVTLDYGGSVAVNLAQRSVAPRSFALHQRTGQVHSVLFQRPICIAHANGGGFSDNTFQLLRTAAMLKFDTVASVGSEQVLASEALRVDLGGSDRIAVDGSLCFGRHGPLMSWRGMLTMLNLAVPTQIATFQGLEFFVLREVKRAAGSEGAPSFRVIGRQWSPIFIRGPSRRPNSTAQTHEDRNRFDILPFQLRVRQGDCLGWRCQFRCDLTYSDRLE
ncbi:unnamed protein product, partial [Prorocentrum cordatum]